MRGITRLISSITSLFTRKNKKESKSGSEEKTNSRLSVLKMNLFNTVLKLKRNFFKKLRFKNFAQTNSSSSGNYNSENRVTENSISNLQNSSVQGKVTQQGNSSSLVVKVNPKEDLNIKKKWSVKSRIDAIPLSTRLVACTIAVLTVAAFCISLSIRQLVGNYLLDKTDSQLSDQAQLICENNVDLLHSKDADRTAIGPNDYFLQIRDTNNRIIATPLIPPLKGNIVSEPVLPKSGVVDNVVLNRKPFTAPAKIKGNTEGIDETTSRIANSPWRVSVLAWGPRVNNKMKIRGYIYIALSLNDQLDTLNTLTRYCVMVSIAVILLGAVFAALIIQSTLGPLKRIEKTASKIASGDLSRRVPSAPINTEVGSLAASLNSMLTRIERGFNEQEAMTEKMKRFVSDASHELRTPLAAIHGYAELYYMWRGMPDEQKRADDSIAHIKASSERMTELVEDLLSLARLDEGRGINTSQTVSIAPIISDAANDLHALDPVRSVQQGEIIIRDYDLSYDEQDFERKIVFTPGKLPNVSLLGDGARLRQVMTNIVGNIHRYTPVDSPVEIGMGIVKASISPEILSKMQSTSESLKDFINTIVQDDYDEPYNNYAIIRVIDHGPGVPEESLPHIFERFYIADPSRAREKGGTGLGMAIAQSVVKAHHGFICATSSNIGAIYEPRNIDDTMSSYSNKSNSGTRHGLTLTVILPIRTVIDTASTTKYEQK